MSLFTVALVLLLGWGALAFGAEYTWAYAPLIVMNVAVGAVGLTIPRGVEAPRAVTWGLAMVMLAASLQVVPMPASLVSAVSPARFETDFSALHAVAVPRAATPEADAPVRSWRPLSIWPWRTLLGLGFLTSLAVLLLGAVHALSVVRPSRLVRGLMMLGMIAAVLGLAQRASGSDAVYGFWYPRKAIVEPTAPFTNSNHAAGWLVMTLSLVVGYFCGAVARGLRQVPTDWRSRVLWFGSAEAGQAVLAGLTSVVMAVAVVVTLSRSGILALVLALGMTGIWAVRRQPRRGRQIMVPLVLGLVLVVAVGRGGLDRVGQELGLLLGLPIIVVFGGMTARQIGRRFRAGRDDPMTYWLRVGAVTGLVAIALQSTVDFSLQMPGNAVLFVVLLAIALHEPRSRTGGPLGCLAPDWAPAA